MMRITAWFPTIKGTDIRRTRRGVALLIVIALMAICLTLFGLWARAIVAEQRRLANQQFRLQAVRLAEAGLHRARARRAADPGFQQETWQVTSEELGGSHAGEVQIRLLPAGASGPAQLEAVAEYPAGSVRRAQITKHIDILDSPSGNEP